MKNKKNRVNIIGKLLYLVVAVLVLMIIPSAAENAYDYFREKQRRLLVQHIHQQKVQRDIPVGEAASPQQAVQRVSFAAAAVY